MHKASISVVIPCFNEENRINPIVNEIKKVNDLNIKEIIIVDDGSDERTKEVLKKITSVILLTHSNNLGKAKALETGFLHSTGEIVVFVDSDLINFRASCLRLLTAPLIDGKYDVVFGDREKDFPLGRLIGATIALTGERAFYRSVIEQNLSVFKTDGYFIEINMNRQILPKYKVAKVVMKNVGQKWKFQKIGLLRGLLKDFKLGLQYAKFAGFKETLFELIFFKRIKCYKGSRIVTKNKDEKKKILILMAKFGGGHEAIAKGIRDAIETYGENKYIVRIEDGTKGIADKVMNYTNQIATHLAKKTYSLIADNRKIVNVSHFIGSVLLKKRLKLILDKFLPDMVLSNHPILNTSVGDAIRKSNSKPVFCLYFADAIRLNELWLSGRGVNYYFAPTREAFAAARKRKISMNKVFMTGWILRKEYYQYKEHDKVRFKKDLGFDAKKYLIYLSGGGDGFGKIKEIVDTLLSSKFIKEKCQIIVICGKNKSLHREMLALQRSHHNLIFAKGYVEVSGFKKAADIICSKAGPNDIFESLVLGKPFFAHGWFWDHEEDNFRWVRKQNIGFAERNSSKMAAKIISCLKNPELLREKIENVKMIREEHVNAPKILVEKIGEILTNTN